MQIELLAPAKNLEQGCAAIDHGADAVYVGAPAFGARVGATNSIDDIERLVQYAHLFGCKVFATVNTLLFDDELEAATAMCHKLYEIGCNALIIQDFGLLECDLPPIEIHASTQMHNIDPKQIKFLEQSGFARAILAREASLEEIRNIRATTHIDLEAFVHGALCVSYSGRCYLSQAITGRSGNRGCCSQPCRSTYTLVNQEGKTLIRNRHLLSLKDFSAAQHIENMIDAGITSFKIEGRLKDTAYVKNVTSYYRQLIDGIIERRKDLQASSSGKVTLHFEPDVAKSFNRGFTDYFLKGRQPMASFATQKSIGEPVGRLQSRQGNKLTIDTGGMDVVFSNGDGLCFIGPSGELEGFQINEVHGNTLVPNHMQNIKVGTPIRRNHNHRFDKMLQGDSASRKIDINIILSETNDGLLLEVTDSDGCKGHATAKIVKKVAEKPHQALEQIERQLSRLGQSPFTASHVECRINPPLFVPTATLNELRRQATAELEQTRIIHFKPLPHLSRKGDTAYPVSALDYRANIVNEKARAFYRRHHAESTEWGPERSLDYDGKALMTTRYCLRYELKECLQYKCNDTIDADYRSTLYLENNTQRFRLHFDCNKCQMQLFLAKKK